MEMTCDKIAGTEILGAKLTGEFQLEEAQSSFLKLLEASNGKSRRRCWWMARR